jgi:hypothetical protein
MLNELPLADQPDREIVEDDERCDRWYDSYLRHLTNQAMANGSSHVPAGSDWEMPTFGDGK